MFLTVRYRLRPKKETKLQENLQLLMRERQIASGAALARHLDLPAQSINRIISGQVRDPRISMLILLADFFCVTIDYLLGQPDRSGEQKEAVL